MIRTAALRTQGGAGPSGVNAAGWRRLCTAFHGASHDLCNSVAQFARRIATTYVDPAGLSAFIACRLIPLDKRPGVRPIGICETVRRIVGKAVMSIVRHDGQEAAGPPYNWAQDSKQDARQRCMPYGHFSMTHPMMVYFSSTRQMRLTA